MREEPSYKVTKWREVGRVADETGVLLMSFENRTEGRVSAELRHLKRGWGVHSPGGSTKHTGPQELQRVLHDAPVVVRFRKAV
jgi:hypothetical protein